MGHTHHEHDHGHHHDGSHHGGRHGGHPSVGFDRAAPLRRDVYRVGRRRFLTELGRNSFAIAILGGVAAACSSTDDDAVTTTGVAPSTTGGPDTTSTPGTTTPGPTTAPTTEPITQPATTSVALEELAWEQVSFGFVSAYVLVRGSEAAVVDTGTPGSAQAIGESLGLLGVTFDDVAHVVLTHKHPDHVGSVDEVAALAATATVYAGEGDIAAIESGGPLVSVGDGDEVLGLQVFETPGHTPGSISLFDPGIGLLVAGDALNGNDNGDGLTGANPDFTEDMAAAAESIAALATLDVRAVAMGHGQPVRDGAGPLLAALV